MRRRKQASAEGSLDLLLDTMCNAFGGIVLIAILVALLIEKPGEDADTTAGNREEAKLLVQKQKKLKELKPRVEEVESQLEKMGELVELLKERNRLAAALSEKTEKGVAAVNSLGKQLSEAETKKAEAEASVAQLNPVISSLKEMIETMKRQDKILDDQTKELINDRKQELKPPVLGNSSGRPFNIIYRYGLVYTLQHFTRNSEGGISKAPFNAEAINMVGGTAQPIKGKGIDPTKDREKLLAILNGLMTTNRINGGKPNEQFFLTNLVYEDSFDTFREMEKLIAGMGGLKSGWRPFTNEEILQFGPEGAKIGIQE